MALNKLLISLFTVMIISNSWAGNGSSGVGTAVIVPGYGALNFKGSVENVNNVIIDSQTKEELIQVTKVNRSEINFSSLSPSNFGRAKGFEFIPKVLGQENRWVLCKKGQDECYRLVPISKTNKKIPSILGSLIEMP